jgi:hypothetical protein
MLKKEELAQPTSCMNKAAPDEPVFVLRAKDPFAAQAVRLWAAMAQGHHEDDKLCEAADLADHMDRWRNSQPPKIAVAGPVDVPPNPHFRR